ncbi:MAG: 4-(cytidine 5'-diphospho)-2-C-methyl-D-erythritol kinase [Solirubrobacteraceae bacterium]
MAGEVALRELAPAKINLCLCVGPPRADGLHELLSVTASITLCDELECSDAECDETLCPGVEGPNLVSAALAAFRAETGWDGPPQRISILKRIPVQAGMGGGSADAAAALRLLARRSGLGDGAVLHAVAATLGSDVPSQLRPGRAIVRGAGELVSALADPDPFGVLVLPSADGGLSTAEVYREADRLGIGRTTAELAALDPQAMTGVNDLAAATLSLQPSVARALSRASEAGASHAMVCGSGPTVIGLFDDPGEAARAAAALRSAGVDARAARPFPRAGALPP